MTDKETMAIIKQMVADGQISQEVAEKYFPELKEKESEDEKIRKELIEYLKERKSCESYGQYVVRYDRWIAWLEKKGEQKPTDKIEPKFKVGDWIITNKKHIWYVDETPETTSYLYRLINQYGKVEVAEFEVVDEKAKLWTIQDAKEGDVLSYVTDEENLWIMIYWSLYEPYDGHVHYHALLVNDNFADKGTCCICIDNLKPATKEQRDLLFQKMKEKGYKWDAEKKELKKIEQKSAWSEEDEEQFSFCCAAIELSNYSSDEYRNCAISFLESLKDRLQPQPKPEWSEEDDALLYGVIETEQYMLDVVTGVKTFDVGNEQIESQCTKELAWLKILKDRVQPQSKQEWSEEDEKTIHLACEFIRHRSESNGSIGGINYSELINRLRSIILQNRWKPSDEQMKALRAARATSGVDDVVLASLIYDLEKLMK